MLTKNILIAIIALIVIIGAINWGYVAYSSDCNDDLVSAIIPKKLSYYVYALVGLSGLALLGLLFTQEPVVLPKAQDLAQAGYTILKKTGSDVKAKLMKK